MDWREIERIIEIEDDLNSDFEMEESEEEPRTSRPGE